MPTAHFNHMNRSVFFRIAGVATAVGLLSTSSVGHLAFAAALSKAQRDKLTPDDIIAMMRKGNEGFRRGEESPHNYLEQQEVSAKGQYPAAVILSCIDSRAPAETIMDLGIGDCFNARVAGNIANADILGSMEFACKLAGAKVVLVMGHTSCGAIKGAIDNAQLGNLTGLLAKIRPAIKATTYKGELTSKNGAYFDAVAQKNVEWTIGDIRKKSPVLAELESKGTIKITGAMYNLETGTMNFFA